MTHGDGTRIVRAGQPGAEQGTPFLPGPVFAGPFHLKGEVASSDWVYTRYGNPTWARYEAALSELEHGEVVLFASGMAAAASRTSRRSHSTPRAGRGSLARCVAASRRPAARRSSSKPR